MFQNVFKTPHRFQWFSNDAFESVFKIYVFQSVQKSHNSFNGFQIMCFFSCPSFNYPIRLIDYMPNMVSKTLYD